MFGVAESRSFQYSFGLHVGVVLLFVLGLPSVIKRAEPQPLVMTVEILPISAMTNVKPSDKPIQERKVAKTPVNSKPIPKTAVEKPKEPEPEPVKKDELTVPDETVKPKPKEKEKPKEEKKSAEDFAALMTKLKTQEKQEPTKEKAVDDVSQAENKTRSDAPYDNSMPLSISEKDMIRSQFVKCWIMPAGSPNPETLIVKVRVALGADGTVTEAKLAADQGRYNSDTFFRAAADSAIRAVWKCSPLKNLPPDKYGSWRDMELTFDPQELM